MKKTVSSARGLKTCLFVLLIGAFLVLSFFTFICAAAPTTVQLTVLSDESGTVYADGKVNDLVYNVGDIIPNFFRQALTCI